MGIQGITKLITEYAPKGQKTNEIKSYVGRKVAIDASMSIYQFLIAVRGNDGENLTNSEGETTSHLMGMFYRTIRMIDNGIKPLYVFDGKPPELKTGELAKRHDKREKNKADLEKAREEGNVDEINKFVRRSVKVTQKHNEECQRLLRYMGVPFVIAKSEAEAQCAELAKNGVVWAVGSEDMDTLMFKAPVLLRRLTFSEARKLPILEFNLEKILEQLGLSYTEFVDLGILLGCDYCDTIRNVGPKTGLQLLQKHRSIEKIIPNLKANSQTVPENFPYETARELFINPEVYSSSELTIDWHMKPNRDEIVKFLCDENGFNRERIIKSIEKLEKGSKAGLQGRLDTFFKPVAAKDAKSTTPVNGAKKRQAGQSGGTSSAFSRSVNGNGAKKAKK